MWEPLRGPLLAISYLCRLLLLQVYSGYRFILTAREEKLPIAILNIGPTRSDHLACLKLDSPCGELLPFIDPR